MKWTEFANKIKGEYEETPNGFISGDTLLKVIIRKREKEEIKIQKKTRRSYTTSSHYNVEKFEIEYSIKDANFGKVRIIRKNVFQRIGKNINNQYKIEGDNSININDILDLEELKYLLKYPKSEFIILDDTIKFKSQSHGEMKEELEVIFDSIEILKNKLNTNFGSGR